MHTTIAEQIPIQGKGSNIMKNCPFNAILPSIMISALFVLSLPAQAETNMRCRDKVIGPGDSMSSITAKCGDPSSVHRYTAPVPRYRNSAGEWVIDRTSSSGGIEMTEWTYNFGRDKLMMRLRFMDGELQDVKSLGYGY
jgi:hypothetical protein